MKKTVIAFTIISIFAKIIAFGRELVLSYFFGAGETSDVFLLSMTLPVTIFGFIAAGVTSGYIPTYQKAKTDEGDETALRFTNNVINILAVICLVIIIIYFAIPKLLLGMFASGFSDDTLETARQFTNITIWATVLTAMVTVLSGFLQINNTIKITALVSVPLNLGIVITTVTAALLKNIFILPIGFLISSIAQVVFLWIISAKKGFRYLIHLDIHDKYLKVFLSKLALLVLSSSLLQVNVLIDRTLATRVIVGGLSIFEYGNRISDFVMGLTIIPISAALFPMMTKTKDDSVTLGKTLNEGIRLSSIIIIPASVIMIVFADVVVRILYFRGAFDAEDVIMTAEVVRCYGVGLFAFSLREMILKCFYAVGDVKSPVINSSIGVVCNIVLNFILLKIMGIGGLALATSVSAVLAVVLLYRSLRKHIGDIRIGSILLKSVLLFAITCVCCYGVFLFYKLLSRWINGVIIPFLISMAVFVILYGVIVILLGIVKKDDIVTLIKRRK